MPLLSEVLCTHFGLYQLSVEVQRVLDLLVLLGQNLDLANDVVEIVVIQDGLFGWQIRSLSGLRSP